MRHVLKLSKTNLLPGLAAALLGLAVCASATSAQTTKLYKNPITAPEFPFPFSEPDDDAPADDAAAGDGRPADLAYGAYQRGFYLTALELALPRAESGDPAAQTLIAELYWHGRGVAQNPKKAAEWYRFAAEGGSREAQFSYASILMEGEYVEADRKLGEQFMRKAAAAGHPRAQFNVAQLITSRRPTWAGFKRALPFYKSAAEAGIADAQYAMANIHAEAKGVPYSDDEQARDWLRKSALGGLDSAQVEYGVWLANGRGGKADKTKARFWFIRAAMQGNILAQNRLARIYAFADPKNPDLVRAGAWHIISRRAGLNDTDLDRLFQSLPDIDKKRAIEAANRLTRSLTRTSKS